MSAVATKPAARAVRPNQVLAIVCVGMCLANLDLFIVNVALPSIAASFAGSNLEGLSWILNAYAIVYAALLVFFGRLVERHRRDQSFLIGVALFTAASAACAAASSVGSLVAWRAVQAAGAALMTPTSIGLLLAVFPAEKRGQAVRTWTAIGGFAAALGPLAGGLLVGLSWRWIFLVNVPIGLAAIVVGWRMLPKVPGHDSPAPRVWPALLVTGGIGALTYAITKSSDWGWSSTRALLAFAAAGLLLALFVLDCLRSKNPFIEPALFRIRPFLGSTLVFGPYSMAFGAMLLSIALWLQEGWGWSPLKAGLTIAPGPFLVPLTSLFVAGRLIKRLGAAATSALGIVLFALGLAWWALLPGPEGNLPVALAGMTLLGLGVGLTFPTVMGVGTAALPPSAFATGSSILNMTRQTALALGVAIFIALLGSPADPAARLDAFERAWWVMSVVTLLCLLPLRLLR